MTGNKPLHLTRRALLAAAPLAGMAAAHPALALSDSAGPRVVSLDYGLASTLLALGVPPVGVTELSGWETWVAQPAMPAGVAELGISSEPNLEVLAALRPDLILATSWLDGRVARLEEIAPVLRFDTFLYAGRPILDACVDATQDIATHIAREEAATALIAEMDAVFAECRARLARFAGRAVVPVHFWDARHVRVCGDPGLLNDVLLRIGLTNGWPLPTGNWGFATLPVEELSRVTDPDALLLVLDPLPEHVLEALDRSPLWQALPLAQPDRILRIDPVLLFGLVPEAIRFARLVTEALESGA